MKTPLEVYGPLVLEVIEKAILDERERCAKIAETEPELPGPIPQNIKEELEKIGTEESHRITVRICKQNIARRIRA